MAINCMAALQAVWCSESSLDARGRCEKDLDELKMALPPVTLLSPQLKVQWVALQHIDLRLQSRPGIL